MEHQPLLWGPSSGNLQVYCSITNLNEVQVDSTSDALVPFSTSSLLTDISEISKSIWKPRLLPEEEHLKFIFNVLRGHSMKLNELKSKDDLIKSVLCSPDPQLFFEVRELVQNILRDIYEQLEEQIPNKNEEFHMEFLIGDILCLFPFLRPVDGDTLSVPVKGENGWQLVAYTVERIELTSDWMGSPLVAYGLSANDSPFPPLLLFKGTTYPSDEGACLSILTDLNPFASVGCYAFGIGRKKIKSWLHTHAVDTKAIVYGKSLGGAQAWRSAINFPYKIGKVMAYGAPGFSPWEQNEIHQITDDHPDLKLLFFCQKNDLVPFSDWPADRGVSYYEVRTITNQENALMAHADIYSTHEHSEIQLMENDQIQDPLKRAGVTTVRLLASALFPLILLGHTVKTTIDHVCKSCLLSG